MSTLHVKYLLIGGGIASSAAAEEIRRRDREGDMLLISQEINRPYRREPLRGAYLKREVGHDDLFTLPAKWLAENHVELHTGVRAVQVDTARQCVMLDDGEDVAFDQLLIGTGSSPQMLNVPGRELPGLLYLRTIEQADTLIHTIDKAKLEGRRHERGRGRAVVVGNGVEAMELSRTLFDLGIEVEIALQGKHPWDSIAGEAAGKLIARELEPRGTKLHVANVERLEGDGRVQRVVLNNGESVATDFVVAMLGYVANKELVRANAVTAEKAILTDDHCRTSVANIYAAGGCAVLDDRRFGRFRTVDAHAAGTIAGANMTGGDATYDEVGTQRSRIFGVELMAFGEAKLVDRRLVRSGSGKFAEIGIDADGRVAQVVSTAPMEGKLVDLVRHRTQISGMEEALKDPEIQIDF